MASSNPARTCETQSPLPGRGERVRVRGGSRDAFGHHAGLRRKALCVTINDVTEPAPIRDHALNNLRYIRDAMERATSFTSIPGWGGVAVGITAIFAAVLAGREGLSRNWMLIWLGEAVLAAAIAGVTMARKAARSGVSFHGAPARRFFIS